MPLSDAKARNAKPRTKPYKISDGEGLFLVVMPSGSKYWRLKYFFAGKEKLLALGVYPDVSLGRRPRAACAGTQGCSPPGTIRRRQRKKPSGWRSCKSCQRI